MGHIILIPSQPVFALINTNFIFFGLTQLAFKPTIYHTRAKHTNKYTTDTVLYNRWLLYKIPREEHVEFCCYEHMACCNGHNAPTLFLIYKNGL